MTEMKDPAARRFAGKVAIVTGAAGGIGAGIATAFAQEGAAVSVADIKLDRAEEVAEGIRAFGGNALAVRVDVADEESTKQLVATTVERLGGLDVLCNNAALFGDADKNWDIYNGPMVYWDLSMAVNVTSVVLCTRAAVPAMKQRGGGVIVNTSSGAAWSNGGVYGTSKMAVLTLTMGFARDLGKDRIRVNAIAPGPTETEAYKTRNIDSGGEAAFIGRLALPRRGTPADQAGGVLYLASDEASWVTGTVLTIDGGFSMRL